MEGDEVDRQEARGRALLDAMQHVVTDSSYGTVNEDAIKKLGRLSRDLVVAAPWATGVHEKVRSALGWAEELYSERRHQKWDPDGAARVRGFMLSDLAAARFALGAQAHGIRTRRGEP